MGPGGGATQYGRSAVPRGARDDGDSEREGASAQRAIEGLEAQGAAALVLADDVMAAPTTATITEAFVSTLKKALAGDGISILDVPVDYSHNVEIGAELHDDVFE